jgi:AcrR family transcriptional regulator
MTEGIVTPKPLRKDAAENRERLFEAAALVFAEQGLEASVDEVARVAGVGVGTLYRRFPTKEALVSELVHDLLETVLLDAQQALEQPDGLGLESFLASAGARQASRRGCLPRLWYDDPVAVGMLRELRRLTADLLVDAQRHGRIREDVVPTDITMVLWSVRGVIETTRSIAPDAWRRHLELVLAGLRPTPETLVHPAISASQVDRVIGTVDT